MGFGMVSLLDAFFRRAFTSAGLRPSSAAVDADTTIHFWAHPSLLLQPSDQQRPVVVLLHGFGPDPTWQWAAQAGPLSRHFDLLVPALLFFGASATRAPARSDAFQAAALAALLTGGHVPGLGRDGRTVHLVGANYGGLVAYHLARDLEQQQGGGVRVGKVVLCDADACWGADDDRALADRSGAADVAELLAPGDTRAVRRRWMMSAYRPFKHIPECFLRDLFRKHFADNREEKMALIKGITAREGFELTPLPQEVLIIWGEFDQIYPVEKAHKMKEKLGEKATVEVIPGTGHLPQQQDIKLFNRVLLDFLLQPSSTSNYGSAAAK
ncbi:hypothetical protein BDA96_03G057000 [Sorghum bicolor]|uniref:AB hydrolase-1 domain-containing protein n=2 Tax=Sorghum bicolor TaxID=4558 RepID=A0A921RA94_SORBI|nr:uncharacterized protein LOC8056557 [Sorghum bicolor]KAG0536360.1 hypothetical protein BDA96_03G057000 [Sorghum bicolor]KXG31766.1 hypothetical protein SORBI_3003G053400 [Sorghum bicolor]|eukprot:XP_021313213.1 uncharacterized protein LOC8056557 [Sorghum bicolor]